MLRPRKHISKQELKEDTLVTFYAKALKWVEDYRMMLIGGAVAIVVVVLGIFFYFQSSEDAEKAASVELAKATRIYESADIQNAIPLLSNLVKNYGSTYSGKLGRFYLANAFFQNKDYDNAKTNFEKFVSGFSGDSHFLAAAQGGAAACLEQKGQYAAAAEAYEKAADRYDEAVLAPQFLFKAARSYELAGQKAKSITMYKRVMEKYPKSPEKDDAQTQLSLLEP
jgi:TolA-binding protein